MQYSVGVALTERKFAFKLIYILCCVKSLSAARKKCLVEKQKREDHFGI